MNTKSRYSDRFPQKTSMVNGFILIQQTLTDNLGELEKFFAEATFERTKQVLAAEIKKVEAEIVALESIGKVTPVKKAIEIKEHAFDQSQKFCKIYIPFTLEAISDEQCQLEVTESSFNLLIHGASKDYKFIVVNLLKTIDASKSYVKVKSDMISVYLKKVKEGEYSQLRLADRFFTQEHFRKLGLPDIDREAFPRSENQNLR